MKRYQKNKAFTLLELLVVIAIIGILASVVLASLSSARAKGNVAAIQTAAKQIQNQMIALTLSGTPLGYWGPGPCPSDTTAELGQWAGSASILTNQKVIDMVNAVRANSNGTVWCMMNDQFGWAPPYGNWAFSIEYPGNTKTWCIDSSGVSKEEPYGAANGAGYGMAINVNTNQCN